MAVQRNDIDPSKAVEATLVMDWSLVVVLGAAVLCGALLAGLLLPQFLPGMLASLNGDAPQAFWFLSRGSALVAFLLLWASMALGLLITNRLARAWPGGPAAVDLHQYVSLLGLGLSLFHALILTGDRYLSLTPFNILAPFSETVYRPLWVGIGQVGFYLWAILVISFYIRKQIGTRLWRTIHFSSFAAFAAALVHGLASGTDSALTPIQAMYWLAGGSLLFLLYYRIFTTVGLRRASRPRA